MKTANCPKHGDQDIGLVCKHVAFALIRRERVGFYWGDDTDTARPRRVVLRMREGSPCAKRGFVGGLVQKRRVQGSLRGMLGRSEGRMPPEKVHD